jgi:hypothetical protein
MRLVVRCRFRVIDVRCCLVLGITPVKLDRAKFYLTSELLRFPRGTSEIGISTRTGWNAGSNFREPFPDYGNSLAVQDKSRKHIEETGFRQQRFGCFRKVLLQILWRFGSLLQQRISPFDNGNKIFKVVGGLKVIATPSPKGFNLGPQEEWCGDDADCLAAR